MLLVLHEVARAVFRRLAGVLLKHRRLSRGVLAQMVGLDEFPGVMDHQLLLRDLV
jgi:hypothetical protein